jgi:putative transcriptional regulator
MKSKHKIEEGTFLVAEPFMWDEHFRRAVILISEVDEDGTTGFILNKNTGLELRELLPDFPAFSAEIYLGGPMETDTLQFLHTVGDLIPETHQIMPGVWHGGNFQQLQVLIKQELIEPHQIRFFVGYTGWEPQQLADEIADKTWVVEDGDPNFVFTNRPHSLWRDVLRNKSEVLGVIGRMPNDFYFN